MAVPIGDALRAAAHPGPAPAIALDGADQADIVGIGHSPRPSVRHA